MSDGAPNTQGSFHDKLIFISSSFSSWRRANNLVIFFLGKSKVPGEQLSVEPKDT